MQQPPKADGKWLANALAISAPQTSKDDVQAVVLQGQETYDDVMSRYYASPTACLCDKCLACFVRLRLQAEELSRRIISLEQQVKESDGQKLKSPTMQRPRWADVADSNDDAISFASQEQKDVESVQKFEHSKDMDASGETQAATCPSSSSYCGKQAVKKRKGRLRNMKLQEAAKAG